DMDGSRAKAFVNGSRQGKFHTTIMTLLHNARLLPGVRRYAAGATQGGMAAHGWAGSLAGTTMTGIRDGYRVFRWLVDTRHQPAGPSPAEPAHHRLQLAYHRLQPAHQTGRTSCSRISPASRQAFSLSRCSARPLPPGRKAALRRCASAAPSRRWTATC